MTDRMKILKTADHSLFFFPFIEVKNHSCDYFFLKKKFIDVILFFCWARLVFETLNWRLVSRKIFWRMAVLEVLARVRFLLPCSKETILKADFSALLVGEMMAVASASLEIGLMAVVLAVLDQTWSVRTSKAIVWVEKERLSIPLPVSFRATFCTRCRPLWVDRWQSTRPTGLW